MHAYSRSRPAGLIHDGSRWVVRMADSSIGDWSAKAFFGTASLLASAAIAFCAWASIAIADRPGRVEVIEMIGAHAPYNQDRKMILDSLEQTRALNTRLSTAIENNTRAVIRLETSLGGRK